MGFPDRRSSSPPEEPVVRPSRFGAVVWAAVLFLPPVSALASDAPEPAPDAWSVAEALARGGPRVPGSSAHEEALRWLFKAMTAVGLEGIEVETGSSGDLVPVQITGRLPGEGPGEILLTAHYDTVAGSPGAVDDASGCGVALAAIADLARTPLRRSVRVILFDEEERGQAGSRGWVGGLTEEEKERTLAALTLEMFGGESGERGVVLTLPARGSPELPLAPDWLVHAVLEGAGAVGLDLAMLDVRRPLMGQLALRTGSPTIASDAENLLRAGIPAVVLTDLSLSALDPAQHLASDRAERLDRRRLDEWTTTVASVVRRLDSLGGRPRYDSEYLVLAGRVWTRRDLLWLCFGVWVLTVWRGLPGPWRDRGAEERRERGRRYLPGFLFRGMFLVSALLAPVLSAVLLIPAALASLLAPVAGRRTTAVCLLGLAPAGLYAVGMLRGVVAGWIRPGGPGLPALALVAATLAVFCVQVRRARAE